MKTAPKNYLSYLLAGTCMAVSAPAFAQEQGAQGSATGGLKEIVVTAQKQAQSQQDVPISVTAVTGEMLQGSWSV